MKKNKDFKINNLEFNYCKVLLNSLFLIYLKNCKNEEEFNLACKGLYCLAHYFKDKAYCRGISFEDFLMNEIYQN